MHSDICKLHQNTVKAESHSELAVTKIETCLCSTVYSFFCMGSCSLYKWWFSGQTVHSLSNCLSMVTMHPGSPRVNFRRKYVFQPLFFFMQTCRPLCCRGPGSSTTHPHPPTPHGGQNGTPESSGDKTDAAEAGINDEWTSWKVKIELVWWHL